MPVRATNSVPVVIWSPVRVRVTRVNGRADRADVEVLDATEGSVRGESGGEVDGEESGSTVRLGRHLETPPLAQHLRQLRPIAALQCDFRWSLRPPPSAYYLFLLVRLLLKVKASQRSCARALMTPPMTWKPGITGGPGDRQPCEPGTPGAGLLRAHVQVGPDGPRRSCGRAPMYPTHPPSNSQHQIH